MKVDIEKYIGTDDALFHYTKTAVALESILSTKKFRLSLLKNTNDPQEYKYAYRDAIALHSPPALADLALDATPIIYRILESECRTMCFCSNIKPTIILDNGSSVVDERASSMRWNKPRMWAQYGENHYGMCLIFSKEELAKELEANKTKINAYKSGFIQYAQNKKINLKSFTIDDNHLNAAALEAFSMNYILRNSEEWFFQKILTIEMKENIGLLFLIETTIWSILTLAL